MVFCENDMMAGVLRGVGENEEWYTEGRSSLSGSVQRVWKRGGKRAIRKIRTKRIR